MFEKIYKELEKTKNFNIFDNDKVKNIIKKFLMYDVLDQNTTFKMQIIDIETEYETGERLFRLSIGNDVYTLHMDYSNKKYDRYLNKWLGICLLFKDRGDLDHGVWDIRVIDTDVTKRFMFYGTGLSIE